MSGNLYAVPAYLHAVSGYRHAVSGYLNSQAHVLVLGATLSHHMVTFALFHADPICQRLQPVKYQIDQH